MHFLFTLTRFGELTESYLSWLCGIFIIARISLDHICTYQIFPLKLWFIKQFPQAELTEDMKIYNCRIWWLWMTEHFSVGPPAVLLHFQEETIKNSCKKHSKLSSNNNCILCKQTSCMLITLEIVQMVMKSFTLDAASNWIVLDRFA